MTELRISWLMHPLMHLKLTTPALHASREIEGILAKEKEGQTATQVTEDRRLLFPHRKYKRTTLIIDAKVQLVYLNIIP